MLAAASAAPVALTSTLPLEREEQQASSSKPIAAGHQTGA